MDPHRDTAPAMYLSTRNILLARILPALAHTVARAAEIHAAKLRSAPSRELSESRSPPPSTRPREIISASRRDAAIAKQAQSSAPLAPAAIRDAPLLRSQRPVRPRTTCSSKKKKRFHTRSHFCQRRAIINSTKAFHFQSRLPSTPPAPSP